MKQLTNQELSKLLGGIGPDTLTTPPPSDNH